MLQRLQLIQSLFQIRNNIFGIFQAHGQADEAGGDVLFREVLVELVNLLARGGVDDARLALVREDVARGEVALLHAAARERYAGLAAGAYDLIYVAPERDRKSVV